MFVLQSQNFDLWQTYKSRQSLRWRVLNLGNELAYIISSGEHVTCVRQQRHGRVLFSGSEEDFYNVWFPYFCLDIDYREVNAVASQSIPPVTTVAKQNQGVHILRLDPWEAVLSAALWSHCSYTTAKDRMANVCEAIGSEHRKSFKGIGTIMWHEVPSPDEVIDGQETLEWFCDALTMDICSSIAVWFKCHILPLATSGEPLKYGRLMHLCKQSGLLSKPQAERIARNGFGIMKSACIPLSWRNKVDTWQLEWEIDTVGYPMGYIGALFSATGKDLGVEIWG